MFRTFCRNYSALRGATAVIGPNTGCSAYINNGGAQRYSQPKWRRKPKPVPGAIEKVVYHKDLFRLEREEKLKEEAQREEELEKQEGYTAENIARMILEQNKDQQQILREADVDDMPIFGVTDPYAPEPHKCILCKHNIELDYKNIRLLSQFLSPHTGQIYGRNVTGLCLYMQKRVAKLIKRARYFGLLPHINKDPNYLEDPQIVNPNRRNFTKRDD